jgi:RNA polymerase sigma-70 factor (ECF subfamily)
VDPVSPSGDLIRRAQTGDHRAFAVLVRACDERMRRLAYRLLGSQTAIDDALQDAYVKAYRNLGTYDGSRSAFPTWLYTIVYNTCLDHIRTRKRRSEVDIGAIAEPTAGADHAERHADADALDTALRDLPPDQAAAVLLVDGDGCTYEEAAVALGVRAGTIASRLHRAHQSLRQTLRINTDEGSWS